jgi:[ribosomal protein S18]-alanine N-acetyltransferase
MRRGNARDRWEKRGLLDQSGLSTRSEAVAIEPMRMSDLAVVGEIDHKCFSQPWQRSIYETELHNRAAFYFVARLEQEIVGYGGAWAVADEAHLTTLAVLPEYRGRRIGERLLLCLMEEAALRRATHVTLEVRERNCPAQQLYRKYGFRNTAIRRSYYTDTGEHAIVMWADAIHTAAYRQRLFELRQRLQALPAAEDDAS